MQSFMDRWFKLLLGGAFVFGNAGSCIADKLRDVSDELDEYADNIHDDTDDDFDQFFDNLEDLFD